MWKNGALHSVNWDTHPYNHCGKQFRKSSDSKNKITICPNHHCSVCTPNRNKIYQRDISQVYGSTILNNTGYKVFIHQWIDNEMCCTDTMEYYLAKKCIKSCRLQQHWWILEVICYIVEAKQRQFTLDLIHGIQKLCDLLAVDIKVYHRLE